MFGNGTSSGSFNISSGAVIELCNCFGHSFLPSSSITGAGTLRNNGSSTTTIQGSMSVPVLEIFGGTTNIDSAGPNTASTVMTFTMSGGTLGGTRIISATNLLDWSGGTMRDAGRTDVLPGAHLNITASSFVTVESGRVLNNFGMAIWSGARITGNGGTFDIPSRGFFYLDSSANQSLELSTFNNQGIFTKTGAGETSIRLFHQLQQ